MFSLIDLNTRVRKFEFLGDKCGFCHALVPRALDDHKAAENMLV
jgi:hypothetical protein